LRDTEPCFTRGSRYRIMSKGPKDDFLITTGEFKGYRTFGNENAIVIEMVGSEEGEKGALRIIPMVAIFAIDVIESKKEEKEDNEATRVYFG